MQRPPIIDNINFREVLALKGFINLFISASWVYNLKYMSEVYSEGKEMTTLIFDFLQRIVDIEDTPLIRIQPLGIAI